MKEEVWQEVVSFKLISYFAHTRGSCFLIKQFQLEWYVFALQRMIM